jgi:Ca2+-binding EF-hand superfamily protein
LNIISNRKLVSSFNPEKLVEYRKTFLEPAKRYPEFSRADVTSMIASFREFDEDDSGTISVNELTRLFAHLGNFYH